MHLTRIPFFKSFESKTKKPQRYPFLKHYLLDTGTNFSPSPSVTVSACTEFRPPFHVCATASQLSYWRIEITSENRKPIADKGQETHWSRSNRRKPEARPTVLGVFFGAFHLGWLLLRKSPLDGSFKSVGQLWSCAANFRQPTTSFTFFSRTTCNAMAPAPTKAWLPSPFPGSCVWPTGSELTKIPNSQKNWGLCFFSVFHKHIRALAFPHH